MVKFLFILPKMGVTTFKVYGMVGGYWPPGILDGFSWGGSWCLLGQKGVNSLGFYLRQDRR